MQHDSSHPQDKASFVLLGPSELSSLLAHSSHSTSSSTYTALIVANGGISRRWHATGTTTAGVVLMNEWKPSSRSHHELATTTVTGSTTSVTVAQPGLLAPRANFPFISFWADPCAQPPERESSERWRHGLGVHRSFTRCFCSVRPIPLSSALPEYSVCRSARFQTMATCLTPS